jgi:hypothetical protein
MLLNASKGCMGNAHGAIQPMAYLQASKQQVVMGCRCTPRFQDPYVTP